MSNRPPTKRIACDECPAIVDGEMVYPHKDQWIDLIPFGSMREMFVMQEYSALTVDVAAAEGDLAETRALNARLLDVYREIHGLIANRVTNWNWTDAVGRKLGKPTEQELQRLSQTEMWWLVRVLQSNGASATSKKESSGTPTTSSDSSQPPGQTNSSTDQDREAAS